MHLPIWYMYIAHPSDQWHIIYHTRCMGQQPLDGNICPNAITTHSLNLNGKSSDQITQGQGIATSTWDVQLEKTIDSVGRGPLSNPRAHDRDKSTVGMSCVGASLGMCVYTIQHTSTQAGNAHIQRPDMLKPIADRQTAEQTNRHSDKPPFR